MTTQATFCATVVDEWARAGVRHAVIAPGSRSTPLALALAVDERVAVQVHHDERCAAFIALGVGVATGVPAVALCTSGTAATHFHAAVVEAHHAGVPLLVCTADRPPELRDVGAPQAIDQRQLYGGATRWSFDPGPPDEAMRGSWRSIAARAVIEALGAGHSPGPVHLNLPFREPLVGEAGDGPPGRADGRPWTAAPVTTPGPLTGTAGVPAGAGRGIVVLGPGGSLPAGCDWPVLAGPLVAGGDGAVGRADALLRVATLADELRPDVVVRLGRPPASRVVNEWIAASGADELVQSSRWYDPSHTAAARLGPSEQLAFGPAAVGWRDRWLALDDAADAAIAAVLADHAEPTEPATARTVLAALPGGAHLVVASSMPVRDLEWYGQPRADVHVHANRGANGIDGTISTAIGVALATAAPTACLLGDVAFLHDSNALIGIADRGVDLTIVVVDNDGGGIFSFLPQASSLPAGRFESLFGTPHGARPEALAAAHGIESTTVDAAAALAPAIHARIAAGGVGLVAVRTDRAANVLLHAELHAAVAAAVQRQ